MALIKCPECGKEISDKASACIHCGFPLSLLKKENTPPKSAKTHTLIIKESGSNKIPIISVLKNYFQYSVDDAKKAAANLPITLETELDIKEIKKIAQRFTDAEIKYELYKYGQKIELGLKISEKVAKPQTQPSTGRRMSSVFRQCPLCGKITNQPNEDYCPKCNVHYERMLEEDTYVSAQSAKLINVPQCPICQSTDLSKISGLSKMGSVALWGIFAVGKVSKRWHCNNCGSEW